jgi:hypothetical protein
MSGLLVFYSFTNGAVTTLNESEPFMVALSRNGNNLAIAEETGKAVVLSSSVWSSTFPQAERQLCHEVDDTNMPDGVWKNYAAGEPYRLTCSRSRGGGA